MAINRKKVAVVLGAVVCLVVIGYVSNWVGAAAEERAVLKAVIRRTAEQQGVPLRVSATHRNRVFLVERLNEIGEPYVIVSESEYRQNYCPHVGLSRAESVAPFVQRVPFWAAVSSTGGGGGNAYTVSVFGVTLWVQKVFTHVS